MGKGAGVSKVGVGVGGNSNKDSVFTDSSVKLIDALCEGPIKGLVDGAKSIYLDRVPIQNSDGSYNFKADGSASYTVGGAANSVPGLFGYTSVPGTNTQGAIVGFDGVQTEESVGQEVRFATGPVTRTITTSDLDAIVLTIGISRLTKSDNEGKTSASELKFNILLKVDSGLFVLQHAVTLNEKSSGGFEVQRTILLPTTYTTVQVRVQRVTADSTSDQLLNSFFWKSYTEVQYEKYSYPNTALVAMEINSKVLQGAAKERIYDIYALEIQIPTNAIVQPDGSLIYSGSWNGTFTTPKWCADPAWCLYDLLANNRYGASVPATILSRSKWDYYAASQWCNEQVGDGLGGMEPRFLLNVILDREYKAYDLIAQLASVFGGIFFALGGGLKLAVDKPLPVVGVLSNQNAKFNYQSGALRNRYTMALVDWQNPDLFSDNDPEVVEEPGGLARYGIQQTRVTAIGCTRRSQARRFGLWYLLTSLLQADTMVATTNILAAAYQPGEILEIADRNKQPYLMGRLISATATTLRLDDDVILSTSQTWTIRTHLLDGTIESRNLQPTSGQPVNFVLAVTPFTTAPSPDSIWVIQSQTQTLPQYQVLAIVPKEKEWQVVMVRYDPTKWAQIASSLTNTVSNVTIYPTVPNKPRNLQVYTVSVPNTSSVLGVSDRLIVSWDYPLLSNGQPDPYTDSYILGYRSTDVANFTNIASDDRTVELDNLPIGNYWIKVVAVDNQGRQSIDISMAEAIPVGVIVNASTQWSMVNSAVFIGMI